MGVLEAGGGVGHDVEHGVRGGVGCDVDLDDERTAEHADSAVDLRLRAAVCGACCAGVVGVQEEESEEG